MQPERWQQVKNILDDALAHSPKTRGAYVAAACAEDKDLRREVESLLEFDDTKDDPIGESVFDLTEDLLETRANAFIGKIFGNYKIIEEIGVGGMGAVFLAERVGGEFAQRVAVKLIKRGLNTDVVRQRFYRERQILASLEHPNVARLIDGGATSDGLPYLVMEYVEGLPITDYARANELTLTGRLDLFRTVCAAVSYAHRNLIVHRDLKPSNILVAKDGSAKLLDFGIAKLLKGKRVGETTQTFVFTPEYASPEQLRGEPLTTSTDIYSLGVILYELLTGARPFAYDGKNFGQIIQTASQIEPPRPSNVESSKIKVQSSKFGEEIPKSKIQNPKLLRGDLDNIILKALKKEPERRYLSVEQLSEDIRRHLAGLPVTARHDTIAYRAEKFMRRNSLVVGTVALAFIILIGGIIAVAWQVRIANHERAKAERRFNDVRTLANSFMFEINEEIDRSPIKARELLVARAIEYLDTLAAEAEGDEDLQSELATAYEKIGSIQSELYDSNIGDSRGALASYQKSLALREKIFSAASQNTQAGLDFAAILGKLGDIMAKTGDIKTAVENYRQSVALSERLAAKAPKDAEIKRQLARSYARYGHAILRTGALPEVLENYRKALKVNEALATENPSDAKAQRSLGVVHSFIGYVYVEMNDAPAALEHYRRAVEACEKAAAISPDEKLYRATLSAVQLALGYGLRETGDLAGSLTQQRKALTISDEFLRADPNDMNCRNEIGDDYFEIANTLAAMGRTSEALEHYGKSLESYEIVRRSDERNAHVRFQMSWVRLREGQAREASGETEKALEIYRESLGVLQELSAADPNNTEWKHRLALCHLRIGEVFLKKNDRAQATTNFETVLPLFEDVAAKSPLNAKRRSDLETVRKYLENSKS